MTIKLARVADIEPQKEQVDGGGWAWRYKVRIMDKHTQDKNVLPDEDLPWAQVIMPVTAGSGAANYAVSPMINQGDTVRIEYYDLDEQQPVITGVLPRTKKVSTGPVGENNGYLPHTGYTERREANSKQVKDESHESNKNSQVSTRSDRFSSVFGDTTVLADSCDPNAYKINAVTSAITNLFNQINNFANQASYIETITQSTIDRIHAIVNPYVGQIFNGLFEGLVPILNQGLAALFKKVFAEVLSATGGNVIAATAAAEAALIALMPAIQALQEAIQMLASLTVEQMLDEIDSLVRDAVDNNDDFSRCAAEDFASAMINDIVDKTDNGMQPLLNAVQIILALASVGGGFTAGTAIRSTLDVLKDLTSALLAPGQSGGGNCGGITKEYAFGIGPVKDVGDVMDALLESANTAKSLVDEAKKTQQEVDSLLNTFGDFPFMSSSTNIASNLDKCSTSKPTTCFGPEVILFGGRGDGAKARAIIGNTKSKSDDRIAGNAQGGIVAIEVLDGGSGYEYPPYVDIRDNCGIGIGGVARAVLKGDKVDKIYMVNVGEDYPGDEPGNFIVDTVIIVDGGTGYEPGINDGYEVITDPGGTVIGIIPTQPVPLPGIPTINIPDVSPPIPPGGNIIDGNVVDENGRVIAPARIGNGLVFYPVIKQLPPLKELLEGNVPGFTQEEVVFIIDCIQS